MTKQQLAINGGAPVAPHGISPRGHVGTEELAALTALFDEAERTGVAPGYNGAIEQAYCDAVAESLGGGYVDAVSSGTAGIYAVLRALDLEPFGEVIVGAVTDPGGMMPIPLLNQIPVIADTAPESYNTSVEQIAPLINPRTRAIVAPHIGGEPADVTAISELAKQHGIPLIEDCSQSHGAFLNGKPLGTFGDLAVFSTMHGKHHSTGGQGGFVFTRDRQLYEQVRRASDRGKPFFLPDAGGNVIASLNLNLSDISAAIGLVQLRKLPDAILRRREIFAALNAALRELSGLSLAQPLPGAQASCWFLRVGFEAGVFSCDKTAFCAAIQAEGLPVMTDYRAALPHLMPWYTARRVFGTSGYPWASPDYKGDREQDFPVPNALKAMEDHFNISIHEGWTDSDINNTITLFRKVHAAYAHKENE